MVNDPFPRFVKYGFKTLHARADQRRRAPFGLQKIFGKSTRAICAPALNFEFICGCYAGGNCETKDRNWGRVNGTGECDVLSYSHDFLDGAGAGAAANRPDHR
jgi:hypothetical protein